VTDQVSHPYKTTGKIIIFLYFNLGVYATTEEKEKEEDGEVNG
jgi:hypothetical protein